MAPARRMSRTREKTESTRTRTISVRKRNTAQRPDPGDALLECLPHSSHGTRSNAPPAHDCQGGRFCIRRRLFENSNQSWVAVRSWHGARVVGTRLPYSARVLCSIGGTPSLSPPTNPKCTPSRYGTYGLLPRAAGNRSSRQNASPPRARHRRAIIPWPERRDREDHDVDMQETAGPEHRRDLKNRKASVLDTPQHPSIGILL